MSVIAEKKITVDELLEMDLDEGFRYELINGKIIKRRGNSPWHQAILGNLLDQLYDVSRKDKIGELFTGPFNVFFDEFNNTEPDFSFVKNSRKNIISERGIEGAPDLIIEILSPSTQKIDKKDKYRIHQQFGVQEYWIVDPNNKTIDIFSLENNRYENLFVATDNDTIQSQVLEGFSLDVSLVFL